MIAILASFLISTNATAHELVASCRSMIPADVELSGRIVLRNRKGIPQAEYGYVLNRRAGKTDLRLTGEDGADVPFAREGRILGTDVTWSDLTLDYLWWDDFSYDAEREGESMQAEEMADGKAVRRLWGTRIKKFGERWMANVLEVETVGSGHRTKITVEALK